MTATIIDGRTVALGIRARMAQRAREFADRRGYAPGLATILVGNDPAGEVYVRNKRRTAVEAGIAEVHHHLDADVSQDELAELIDALNTDPGVSGILLQLPLPEGLERAALIDRISPAKDVDGLTTLSQERLASGVAGLRPCTPAGVLALLDSAGVVIEGSHAVVMGRSELVGHPVAELLLRRNATVTIAHSHTRDLAAVTSRADILVAGRGNGAFGPFSACARARPGQGMMDPVREGARRAGVTPILAVESPNRVDRLALSPHVLRERGECQDAHSCAVEGLGHGRNFSMT